MSPECSPEQPLSNTPPTPAPPPVPPSPPPVPPSRPPAPPTTPPVKKAPKGCGFWLITAAAVIFFFTTALLCLALFGLISAGGGIEASAGGKHDRFIEHTVEGTGEKKILLVPISGIIGDIEEDGFFRSGPGMVAETREMLKLAREDRGIKAVLLVVESPGGGITASDVLYHELDKFHKETGKDIVALFGDVAASGGYYVAAGSQYIVAHPTTVTGSIGVIMPLIGIEDLLDKIGVKPRTIKSGDMKDTGSMVRAMRPEERKLLQDIVDEYCNRFVSIVHSGMQGRGINITRERLKSYCDGRVFTGEQAKALGFVDQIGYFEDAFQAACQRAGISPKQARVIQYHRKPGLLDILLSRMPGGAKPNALTLRIEGLNANRSPRFLYLWTVGEQGLK